jgi:hypothetical protein
VIAAVFLFPRTTAPPRAPTMLDPSPLPTVEAAPGRTVAVLPTDNPDITVLWFFQER